jgi:hypothetical protein
MGFHNDFPPAVHNIFLGFPIAIGTSPKGYLLLSGLEKSLFFN